jgi:peptidyl-prolyl cis-trans isomerase SurA
MTLTPFRTPAAFVFAAILLSSSTFAQTRPVAPESPYGGTTVEEIIARVNDQIITRSDFDRAQTELDQEGRQRGATRQEIFEGHKDLLRNLIDQQLWLAKGKELGITGETELVNRLNDLRKQYNLATMEDLEKAAKDQGVSFEDFKASIRNGLITQEVMRDQVGRKISATPGEVQRFFEEHKQEYVQPESVKLSEILVSTGTPAAAGAAAAPQTDDAQKLADAKTKVDDLEARLHAGGDFTQLARSFSDGPTAASGGDLGQYKRGQLDKLFEEKTFGLKTGEYTEPIRTKQGFVILKVVQHVSGGVPEFKDVEPDVENSYYMSKMEPAVRAYLTKLRDEAAIYLKPGYEDSGASAGERHPSITFSAYTPPTSKKKKKVERTRFRETTHTFRQKSAQPAPPPAQEAAATAPAKPDAKGKKKKGDATDQASMKAGKKEKIRFGKAPQQTLPSAPSAQTEDAGATQQVAANAAEPDNPLESNTKPDKKSRFSERAKAPKQPKAKGPQPDPLAPQAPDAAEVADRQAQAGPLGLGGNTTASKKKKKSTTTGEKTRLADKKKSDTEDQGTTDNSIPVPQQKAAPAPAPAPTTPEAPAPTAPPQQ